MARTSDLLREYDPRRPRAVDLWDGYQYYADHLDVIGHYEAAGATFLKSGSKFDDNRFRSLWERVGRALRSPPADA